MADSRTRLLLEGLDGLATAGLSVAWLGMLPYQWHDSASTWRVCLALAILSTGVTANSVAKAKDNQQRAFAAGELCACLMVDAFLFAL